VDTTDRAAHPLLRAAREILPDVIAFRRALHRVPEVGLEVPRTQALVLDAVRDLGLDPIPGVSVGSVVATIEGAGPGPTILLRADMDGLPLTEETGLEFASEHDGRMHACGHDTHVAMLLGAARLLIDDRATWPGRVLLMFQPGEEGFHGARLMLDEGLLDRSGGERPNGAFALHISTLYETGTIDIRPGPMLASADTLRITVHGRGGHASTPYTALDPVTVAAEIVLGLQTMVTRRVDVFDPAVVTIAQVVAGTTTNVIPETAYLGGTMRTISARRRDAVRADIRRLCEGIAAAHGASVDVDIEPGYPVTVNDDSFTDLVLSVAREVVGEDETCLLPAPIMGAEDFSYVLQQVPGAIGFVGARPAGQDPATAPMNHSNRVVFDETAMAAGIATYVGVARRHLTGA
jgi:hippurate hydrolase